MSESIPFRYWDQPPPGPMALAMLQPSKEQDRLQALLTEGESDAIEEWLATAAVSEEVKNVLRRGLRDEDTFDSVEVARLRWEDRTGSSTSCVVRRQENGLVYEVRQDGDPLVERETDRELIASEILELMLTANYDVDDFEGLVPYIESMTRFESSSDFHNDLMDYDDWIAELDLRNRLVERVIEACQLPGYSFAGMNLEGLRAGRANLEGACFYRACLAGADFHSANLRHADLRGSNTRGADFTDARLTE